MTQLLSLVVIICTLVMLSLLVWYRRPAGRGTSGPSRPDIKGIGDFDDANPGVLPAVRTEFVEGFKAHVIKDYDVALRHYHGVLENLPGDSVTQHNIQEIKLWREDK